MSIQLDHFVVAVPDIMESIDEFENLTGIRPAIGGGHDDIQSQNALVSLGSGIYLELIGKRPGTTDPNACAIYGINKVTKPTIVGWALATDNNEEAESLGKKHGLGINPIYKGTRIRPDGKRIRWESTSFHYPELTKNTPNFVPFVVNWLDSEHPSTTAPNGAAILETTLYHPNQIFLDLAKECVPGINVILNQNSRMTLKLQTPKGVWIV